MPSFLVLNNFGIFIRLCVGLKGEVRFSQRQRLLQDSIVPCLSSQASQTMRDTSEGINSRGMAWTIEKLNQWTKENLNGTKVSIMWPLVSPRCAESLMFHSAYYVRKPLLCRLRRLAIVLTLSKTVVSTCTTCCNSRKRTRYTCSSYGPRTEIFLLA